MSQRKLYIETYGCQMNVADSHLICGHLEGQGYVRTDTPEDADVILVNTCAVREHAEQRVWGRLSDLARYKQRNPEIVLGVVGCMAQHWRDKVWERAPYVDLVVGPDAYRRLPDLLQSVHHSQRAHDVRLDRGETYADLAPAYDGKVTAFVSIMRGCDQFCTFCIVPYVRGRERSVPAEAVLGRVRELVARGVKEVTFLGQTVNAYRHGETTFADLLRQANEIRGLERIRFTSPHPVYLTEEVIAAMAECEKVMPALHLPLQSASDAVLKRMNRQYTLAEYDRLVHQLRTAIPDLALTTDILVGFPGEREEDFQATYAYLEKTRYDAAFMFKYSPRPGTRAYKWGDPIPEEEKIRRLEAIIELQERVSAEINAQAVGSTVEVLVEGQAKRGPGWYGRSPQFKNVVFTAQRAVRPGELVRVKIADSTAHTLKGALAGGKEQ